MKKQLAIIFLFIISFAIGNCKKEQEKIIEGIVTEDQLNIRETPKGKIIYRLNLGDKVQVLGRSEEKTRIGNWENYWYKIKTSDGRTGWCFAQWIDTEKTTISSQTASQKLSDYDFFLYATNFKDNNISIFSIDESGNLKLLGLTKALKEPKNIAAHPVKNNVYVIDKTRIISYKIRKNGTLEPMAVINKGAGGEQINVHPNGRFVYSTSSNPILNISMYKVEADGRLKAMGDVMTNKGPRKFALHPFGSYAYFHDRHKENRILSYIIKHDGKLHAKTETALGGKTDGAISIKPDGKLLFVAEWVKGCVSVYSINTEGEIKLKNEIKNLPNIAAINFSPDGKYVYMISKYGNKLYVYKPNDKGEYISVAELATGTKPVDLKVHPKGNVLYVSNEASNDIYIFNVNNGGAVTLKGKTPTGINPVSLSIGRIRKAN